MRAKPLILDFLSAVTRGILPAREIQPARLRVEDLKIKEEIPVRFHSLCMLMLMLLGDLLAMSSQAQETKRTGN
jgi:hypothetical protein